MKPLKFKKAAPTDGACQAMRCILPATTKHMGYPVCARHDMELQSGPLPVRHDVTPPPVLTVDAEPVDETTSPEALAHMAEHEGKEVLAELAALTITDQADVDFASDIIAEAKSRWRALDAKEKEITRPMNEALKRARDLFREPKRVFEEIEATTKKVVGDYHLALEAKRDAAMVAAGHAAAAGDTEGASSALASIDAPVRAGGLSVRTKWVWELTDFEAVPREFLTVDPAKAQAAADAYGRGEGPAVAGLHFVAQKVVASIGRRST